MPLEVVRFGVGHRRPQGPPGTVGLSGTPIHADARGVIAELAFIRGARIEPHSNPNLTWFVVIEGGGWVQVGEEQTRIAAGEAVLWPPDIDHSAWTDYAEMRAIVVEFGTGSDDAPAPVLEGHAVPLLPSEVEPHSPTRGEGALREESDRPAAGYDPAEGEPRSISPRGGLRAGRGPARSRPRRGDRRLGRRRSEAASRGSSARP